MHTSKKIAVLLHKNDPYPDKKRYFIFALCDIWREMGIEIEFLKGLEKITDADLLIPQIDTTVVPQEYVDYYRHYPRVLNSTINDISKRVISQSLINENDDYTGPVIVKTDLNYGGLLDLNFEGNRITLHKSKDGISKTILKLFKKKKLPDWADVNCMNPLSYQVFPSIKMVPDDIFSNKSLVIEKFLPEYEDEIYYIRIYKFFGDKAYCARLGSNEPIVKAANIMSREEAPIPREIKDYRQSLGMDYGKIDFVIHDGKVVVFDVNKTPGRLMNEKRMKANALALATGINQYLD